MQENNHAEMIETIAALTHELALLLEIYVAPADARQAFPEALKAVARGSAHLTEAGLPTSDATLNVLRW